MSFRQNPAQILGQFLQVVQATLDRNDVFCPVPKRQFAAVRDMNLSRTVILISQPRRKINPRRVPA